MTVLPCPVQGCSFKTFDFNDAAAAAILVAHYYVHITPPSAAPSSASKLVQPKIQHNSTSSEDWNAFVRHLETFLIILGVKDTADISQPLWSPPVAGGNVVLEAHPNFTSQTINDALAWLKVNNLL